jgi:hypothetical protein
MASDLLNRMPPDPQAKKNRAVKHEYESSSPSVDRSRVEPIRVPERDYESAYKLMNDLMTMDIPKDLRNTLRKTITDWAK